MTVYSKRNNSSSRRRRLPCVELLESRQLLATFVVNSLNDSGPGTLRRAIINSNNTTGSTNLITFSLGTPGVQAINLLSALPTITQSVTIDGTSQSGYSGTPLVELNGAGAGAGVDGLIVAANNSTVQGLMVTQFSQDGIQVTGNGNLIDANYIGTENSGGPAVGNGRQGLLINGANNTVGGSTSGVGNIITGNGNDGLQIAGVGATGNVVQGNSIVNSVNSLPNGRFGILINFQASNNLIGTNGDGVNDKAERNVISGNTSWGIEISDVGTQKNVVAGNFIGTGIHGAAADPNGDGGVIIQSGATSNLIGTDGLSAVDADESNLISGNGGVAGVMITGSGTNSNVVAGNLIGTDANGTGTIANAGDGVLIQGGAQSNTIGTNGDGKDDAAESNVISGNTNHGVYIGGTGTNLNVVAGNLIGVDISSTNVLANLNNGVWIAAGAQSNRIGVAAGDVGAALEANVISGNDFSGVLISDAGTNFNVVTGNFLGNNTSDSFTVSNGIDGVTISRGAQSNTIGGSIALANTIVNNINNGVTVMGNGSRGNTIRFNHIRKNFGGLGIDLNGDGVSANHGNTSAVGPNGLQNFPVISSAAPGTSTTVGVSFVSLPSATYTLDFYESAVADPTGFGEGNRWLGSAQVTTDVNGQLILPATFNFLSSTSAGQWITATATDQAGDTSEFSNAFQLATVSSPVTLTPSISTPTYGQNITYNVSAAPNASGFPTPTGTVQFQVDGAPFVSAVTLVNGAATRPGTHALPAGTHTISVVYSGDSTYAGSTTNISQTVAPASLTVTAVGAGKVYGAADPVLAYSVQGLVNGDSPSVVTGVTLATTTGAAATAGTHTITASGGSAANYTVTDVNGTLTVSKAPLAITVDNKAKVYGAVDPTLTFTPHGSLFYGDTYAVISGVNLATTTGAAATAGTHEISATDGIASNYSITTTNGTLTVSKAALTVTVDNKAKVYGEVDPTLSFTPHGSLFYGDTYAVISGVTLATTTGAAATAGTHAILVNGGTASNYSVSTMNGTLTVSKAPLVLTADNQVKVYGLPDPVLTFTPHGLLYADTRAVVGGVTLTTTTGPTATAATHPIVASGGTASNYTITDLNGVLTVAKATLIIVADNQVKLFGAPDPALTYSVYGLAYGDSRAVISSVALSTATGAAATAGPHLIFATGGTASNYAVTDVNGILTVVPLPLATVTSVHMIRLKQKHKIVSTDIVVSFSGAVDAGQAGNSLNYSLAAPGKGKQSKIYNKRINLKSVTYNRQTHQVTLEVRGTLTLNPHPQLRIIASGIADIEGRPIDGNGDGQSGGDFVTLLNG